MLLLFPEQHVRRRPTIFTFPFLWPILSKPRLTCGTSELDANCRLLARNSVDLAMSCWRPSIPLDTVRGALWTAGKVRVVEGVDDVERLAVCEVRRNLWGDKTSLMVDEGRGNKPGAEERNIDPEKLDTSTLRRPRALSDEVHVFADVSFPLQLRQVLRLSVPVLRPGCPARLHLQVVFRGKVAHLLVSDGDAGGGRGFAIKLLTFFFHFRLNSFRSFALTEFAQRVRTVAGSKSDMGACRKEVNRGLRCEPHLGVAAAAYTRLGQYQNGLETCRLGWRVWQGSHSSHSVHFRAGKGECTHIVGGTRGRVQYIAKA